MPSRPPATELSVIRNEGGYLLMQRMQSYGLCSEAMFGALTPTVTITDLHVHICFTGAWGDRLGLDWLAVFPESHPTSHLVRVGTLGVRRQLGPGKGWDWQERPTEKDDSFDQIP